MKIPCSVVRDLLPLYAEEMTEEETRTLVDEHLEECSECSQKLEEIKAAAAVPAENTAVDTAKPLLALKKTINKRRWMTAAAKAARLVKRTRAHRRGSSAISAQES